MKASVSGLLALASLTGVAQSNFWGMPFQYDYCSYLHSQFVLDKINSLVKPVLDTYGIRMAEDAYQCQLNNFGLIEDQLRHFGRKNDQKKKDECPICKKKFESEDWLEYHMKAMHFRNLNLQDRYQKTGTVCPADLCDIFECPEFSEKALKLQVYRERTDENYEGKNDYLTGIKRNYKKNRPISMPYRYEMLQHYSEDRRATLLQRCHRTFLDCIDFSSAKFDDIIKAFDFLSQLFCEKFEEGELYSME